MVKKLIKQAGEHPATNQRNASIGKVILYTLIWILLWIIVASILLILISVLTFNVLFSSQISNLKDISNRLFVIVLLLAFSLSTVVFLLWKRKSLFWRTARNTLLVCTLCGLLVGIPLSSVSEWGAFTDKLQSEDIQQPPTTKAAPIPLKEKPSSNKETTRTSQSSEKQNQRSSSTASQTGCDYFNDVPYRTVTKTDSNMKSGETRTIGGYNGWRTVCKDRNGKIISDKQTSSPTDKIIYQGTYTYEEALADARAACLRIIPPGSQQSTDWGDCVSSQLQNLW